MTHTATQAIAILATGDELLNGDTTNTNGLHIAQALETAQLAAGQQLIVGDQQDEICAAIHYLLSHHQALIIIGGLGPTCDDLTRYALADYLECDLQFDPDSWEHIKHRFAQYAIPLSDNNKQQCYFPEQATILTNPNGTANGAIVEHHNKLIIILPGPPSECLPLFHQYGLPRLAAHPVRHSPAAKKWLLLGMGESTIANAIDEHITTTDLTIGYRASYPYIEVKFFAATTADLTHPSQQFEQYFTDIIVSDCGQTASTQLRFLLQHQAINVHIDDQATQGLLQHTLTSPGQVATLYWQLPPSSRHSDITLTIQGLEDYWQANSDSTATVSLHFTQPDSSTINHTVKLIRADVMNFVVETICYAILEKIT